MKARDGRLQQAEARGIWPQAGSHGMRQSSSRRQNSNSAEPGLQGKQSTKNRQEGQQEVIVASEEAATEGCSVFESADSGSNAQQQSPIAAIKQNNSSAAAAAEYDPYRMVVSDSESEGTIGREQRASCSHHADSSIDSDHPFGPTTSFGRRLRQPAAVAANTPQANLQRKLSNRENERSAATAPHQQSLQAAAAATAGDSSGKIAAATPKRGTSRGSPVSEQQAAATSHRTPKKAATPAATPEPSRRTTRSCTKAAALSSPFPSLATPLAKLSLSSRLQLGTPPPAAAVAPMPTPTGKRLRSSSGVPPASKAGDSRPTRRTAGSQNSRGRSAIGVLQHVEVDGEVVACGDDVYLRLDDYEHEEQQDEACEVCSSSKSKNGNPIMECSTCLRGFHLCCLKPPLEKVPDGDWLCPDCNAGGQPPHPAMLTTMWQKLLYGTGQLALVHVLECQTGKAPDGTEEDQLLVQYYILPQETHIGRQRHHGAREVFLGTKTFMEPACAVAGRAFVHPPQTFAEAHEHEGNDVFLCEYEYDEAWKRFRIRQYGNTSDALAGDGLSVANATRVSLFTPRPVKGVKRVNSKGWSSSKSSSKSYNFLQELDHDESGLMSDDDVLSNDGDESDVTYRPNLGWLGGCRQQLIKHRRHGQLPTAAAAAAATDRFAGLGAADITCQRGEPRDAFQRLYASLSLTAVPSSLPCRENQRSRLQSFVNTALREDGGGILYICGVPGTGKTALVMEVLGSSRDAAVAAGAQVVAINCLQLPSPQHVFSRLWEKLSGQHLGPARACNALIQAFGVSGQLASRRRYSTIIVLDEIDMLMTRDQAVLYQLFDWPSHPGARLSVVGISNTHDLDQRVLPRIASRLDQAKLAFAPYSVTQLLTIVTARLDSSGVAGALEDAAVQLACRKVASETGDVRRALEMLRRAVEIGQQQQQVSASVCRAAAVNSQVAAALPRPTEVEWKEGSPALIKRMHVTQAQQEMFNALHHQLLRSRSLWEKLLLVAVVVEARATGHNAVVIQNVAERASNSICSLVDLAPPALGVLQHCLVRLATVRLLLSDGCHMKAHVALNVDKDDVAVVIKEDERLQRLHQLI